MKSNFALKTTGADVGIGQMLLNLDYIFFRYLLPKEAEVKYSLLSLPTSGEGEEIQKGSGFDGDLSEK